MENTAKKTIRSNKAQIKFLCHYMSQNPAFAAGEYKSPLGVRQINEEWAGLKRALDELGPSRTVDQWKICWRDQKRKARDEGGALNRVRNTTGNVIEMPELSENSALVLGTIGHEMAVGCGPEESPMGFTRAITPLPTPGPSTSDPVHAAPGSSGIHMPAPRASSVQRPAVRRACRVLPPERFLNAQIELNNLIKELIAEVHSGTAQLIEEVRHSNKLREENLKLLRRDRNEE